MQKSYVTAVFDRKNQVKTRGVGKVEIYVYLRRDQKKYITIKTCTESEWKFFQHSVTLASEISMYSSIIAEMEENEEEMLMFNFEKRLGMDANSRENLEKARIASSPTSFLDFMMTEIEKEKIAPVHLDIYDDRLEVYSPGGMMDGKHIQDLDLLNVPSKRRNPLLADFFNRLDLMERRGSGMRKIIDAYQQYEKLETYKRPVFRSDSDEFHVTLWNLNYGHEHAVKTLDKPNQEFTKEFTLNKDEFTKEFVKAQREIYRCISKSPYVTREEISKQIGLSVRQI